jgi:hypothetical protein
VPAQFDRSAGVIPLSHRFFREWRVHKQNRGCDSPQSRGFEDASRCFRADPEVVSGDEEQAIGHVRLKV